MPRLFEDLSLARLDDRFPRPVDKLARVQLLILDDWGTHTLTDQQRLDLLEIFEERYRRKSTLITPQLPVAHIADAILDRIIHNARRIVLESDSMRPQKPPSQLTGAENGEINRSSLQPGRRKSTTPCCPGICETTVRDLVKQLSRFAEMRNHGMAGIAKALARSIWNRQGASV